MAALMAKHDDDAPATKRDLNDLRKELKTDMGEMKEEILRHFDVVAEDLRHDVMGANRDEVELIKDRVTKLERHTGLIPV